MSQEIFMPSGEGNTTTEVDVKPAPAADDTSFTPGEFMRGFGGGFAEKAEKIAARGDLSLDDKLNLILEGLNSSPSKAQPSPDQSQTGEPSKVESPSLHAPIEPPQSESISPNNLITETHHHLSPETKQSNPASGEEATQRAFQMLQEAVSSPQGSQDKNAQVLLENIQEQQRIGQIKDKATRDRQAHEHARKASRESAQRLLQESGGVLSDEDRQKFEEAAKTGVWNYKDKGPVRVEDVIRNDKGEPIGVVIKLPGAYYKEAPVIIGAGGKEEGQFLYYVHDPEYNEVDSVDSVRRYIDKILRPLERQENVPIDPSIEMSLIETVRQSVNQVRENRVELYRRLHGLAAGAPVPPGIVNLAPLRFDEIEILVNETRGRIHYHDAAIMARASAGRFSEEFTKIQRAEHLAIYNISGVREALEMAYQGGVVARGNPPVNIQVGGLFVSEGITRQEIAESNEVLAEIAAPNGNLNPNLTAEDIGSRGRLVADLVWKMMDIFGESVHQDGIVLNGPGNTNLATNPTVFRNRVGDMQVREQYARFYQEHYPVYTAREQEPPYPPQVRPSPAYPGVPPPPAPGPNDYNPAAHPDAINPIRSMSGSSASSLRELVNNTIGLMKGTRNNRGEARYLRRYAYSWITSAVHFERTGRVENRKDLFDQMDALSDPDRGESEIYKLYAWADAVSAAAKGKEIFADKGDESILKVPLINPNQVRMDNSFQVLPRVLQNLFKVAGAYPHLSDEQRQETMTYWVKGVLYYHRHPKLHRYDGFNWLRWNDAIMWDALTVCHKGHLITEEQANEIMRELGISRTRAVVDITLPQYGHGFRDFLREIWKLVARK